jgi:hypothetical protein
MAKALLLPALVLIAWSLVVLTWLAVARVRGVKTVPRETMRTLPKVGGRGQDLDPVMPAGAAWVSHNYTHLMEQPTLFYATVVTLAVLGQATTANIWLAWGYVVFRIAHSLWQIVVNTVPIRFALFLAATACLAALVINGLRVAL